MTLTGVGQSMGEVQLSDLVNVQNRVREAFGWSHEADVESAKRLLVACDQRIGSGWERAQRDRVLDRLGRSLRNADRIVFVGADAAKEDLKQPWPEGTVFVAADGAVGACLGVVRPLCVVTDLDGGHHLEQAVEAGVPLVMHAHGDNRATWEACLRRWQNASLSLVLTHQTNEQLEGMHNPGGFTDGDRAVCFARWLGVSLDRATFVGYAPDRVGPWSAVTEPGRKLKKLAWMAEILDLLAPHWRDGRPERNPPATNGNQTQA